MRDECFTAERGKGARLNGEPIRVSEENDPGNEPGGHRLSRRLQGSAQDQHGGADPAFLPVPQHPHRRFGGPAHGVCGGGKAYRVLGAGANAWDLAAGTPAGGGSRRPRYRYPGETLDDIGVRHVLATNGRIHEAMLEELRAAEATGFEKQEG